MGKRVHCCGTDTARDIGHHGPRCTAPQQQAATTRRQILRQRGEAVVQPPALRRAHRPGPRGFIVKHEQRHHRAGTGGCSHGGVVGKPKVVAEPDDMRG